MPCRELQRQTRALRKAHHHKPLGRNALVNEILSQARDHSESRSEPRLVLRDRGEK